MSNSRIYLYKKTHNKTGLQYLGKTISSDPHKYQGSGTYWVAHINKHGYDVTTEILKECQTNEEVNEWGLHYSKLWNIVDATDKNDKKIWANLMPESGKGGTTSEVQNRPDRLEKNRQAARRSWQDPDIREKRIAAMEIAQNDPQLSRSKSNAMKKTLAKKLQNPKFLKKCQDSAASMRLKNALVDRNVYEFEHRSGTIEQCTRATLINKYSLHKGSMSYMINGKAKSVSGWKLIGKVEK